VKQPQKYQIISHGCFMGPKERKMLAELGGIFYARYPIAI
jgi:hypothetical protein